MEKSIYCEKLKASGEATGPTSIPTHKIPLVGFHNHINSIVTYEKERKKESPLI